MQQALKYFFLSIGILFAIELSAQTETDTSETKGSAVKIYGSDFFEFRGDLDPPEQHYKGNVKMTHDSIYMFADSTVTSQEFMSSVGNIVIIQEDTIRLFSDSLFFDTKDGKAELFYQVVLENGKQQLFTERLDYYTETKIAVYPDTALLKNDRTKLSSLRGRYDVNEALATFVGEVIVLDEEFSLTADSLLYNTNIDKAIFVGPTNIVQTDRKIYCESGYYDIQNGQALFEQNASYVEGDQEASAHQIRYSEDTGEITLTGNAKYKDAEKNATADKMVYDENTKDILLIGNAYFFDGETTATGDEIKYNEDTGEVNILGQAIIDSEDTKVVAANTRYDEARGVAIFEGDVVFLSKNDSVSVYSDIMEVDSENKINIATGESRPYMLRFIDGDSMYLSADTLYVQERIDSIFTIERIDTSFIKIEEELKVEIDEEVKDGIKDSLDVNELDEFTPKPGEEEKPSVEKPDREEKPSEERSDREEKIAEEVKPSRDEKRSEGKKPGRKNKPGKGEKPIIDLEESEEIKKEDEIKEEARSVVESVVRDSMILDTVKNFIGLDTVNVFKAYDDVRILSEEFQAISDSMYYDTKDSLFVLFKNPIMWSDSMQFTGDTIKIKLAEKGIETVFLNGKAMINELIQADHYNQLKAKYIEAWIDSSTISFMKMRQNAESNYYIMDSDKAFVGLNHTLCNRMNFYFEGGEMSDIKFYEQPTSVLTPMGKLKREQLFLKDFSWKLELKPNTLEDLLKPKEISEISVPVEVGTEELEDGEEKQEAPIGSNQSDELIKDEGPPIKPKKKN